MTVIEMKGKIVDKETGEVVAESEEQGTLEGMPAVEMPGPLTGSEEQLSFDMGSHYALNTSTLKIGAIPLLTVEGQYKEGDRLRVIVEVEVESIAFPPVKHRGFRVGTERRHLAQPLAVAEADE